MSEATQEQIRWVCDEIKAMLIAKNESYGDSALNPVRIFSRSNTKEQLAVRVDDKLSRVARGHEYVGDNDLDDLIGYLMLMKVARLREKHGEAQN